MSYQANAKVRAEHGGEAAAAAKVATLKTVWPSAVVKHCDLLLTAPMGDSTYEALLAACAWRADRPIPEYARAAVLGRRPGRPRTTTGNTYAKQNRVRARANQRALRRLKALHPEEFAQLYQEERAREAAPTKETA